MPGPAPEGPRPPAAGGFVADPRDGLFGDAGVMTHVPNANAPVCRLALRAGPASAVIAYFRNVLAGAVPGELDLSGRQMPRGVAGYRLTARLCCAGTGVGVSNGLSREECVALVRGLLGRACPDEALLRHRSPVMSYWAVAAALSVLTGVVVTPLRAFGCFERPERRGYELTEYGEGLLGRCGVAWPPGFLRLAPRALPPARRAGDDGGPRPKKVNFRRDQAPPWPRP